MNSFGTIKYNSLFKVNNNLCMVNVSFSKPNNYIPIKFNYNYMLNSTTIKNYGTNTTENRIPRSDAEELKQTLEEEIQKFSKEHPGKKLNENFT